MTIIGQRQNVRRNERRQWSRRGWWAIVSCGVLAAGLVLALVMATARPLSAQDVDPLADDPDAPTEPQIIRFMTDNDYPPFHYYDDEGVLTGFNVDVARAICLQLDVTCDIVEASWDSLLPSLQLGDADAIIASHAVTPQTIAQAAFTDPYYFTPGRFIAQRGPVEHEITAAGLEGIRVGVTRGTAHEAFLRTRFPDSIIVGFDNDDDTRDAVRRGEVPYVFGDGISLTFWLNGTSAETCCIFAGEPYVDPHFFGPGIGIAVARQNHPLRKRLNEAIGEIRASGRLEELFFRYFPLRVY